MILILFVLLAQQVTTPAIQSGSGVTWTGTTTILNGGDGANIAECEEGFMDKPPTRCHLVNGHSLDDVIAEFWKENQLHRQLAQDYADRLKKDIELARDMKKVLDGVGKEKANAKP